MLEQGQHPPLYGLIPAAGKGVRAQPYTQEIHKGMLSINGVPNIERIVCQMRDDLGIKNIVIVTGHLGESIQNYFGDGHRLGVSIAYVENNDLDRGWAWSVYLAKDLIPGYFCIMLCDECYLHSNHRQLREMDYGRYLAVCAGLRVDDAALVRKNYAIEQREGKVSALYEKPETVTNDIMGSGTFICSPIIFDELEQAFSKQRAVDFVGFLNQLLQKGKAVGFFELSGTYVNINDRDSLYLARYHERISCFDKRNLSLLVVSEGDEAEIGFTIKRYHELGLFHQIAVVLPYDNVIQDIAVRSGAEIIVCPPDISGFGERMYYGLDHARGDIFICTEADYSFANRDVEKLLVYLKEADMVVGTRTTRQLIEQGSSMKGLVRIAHAALGKLLEIMWWTREGRFTDVGCTFRAIWRSSWLEIRQECQSAGPEFLMDMVVTSLEHRLRILEIPVNYFNRSQSQNRHYRNPATFFRLLAFMFKRRLSWKKSSTES